MKTAIRPVRLLAISVSITMVIVLGGILSPSAATAATYYVATTGKDSNPGTQSRPFRTINKGMSVLTAGSILYVRSGIYERIYISIYTTPKIPTGTSWANAPRIAAYPGEKVTIKGIGLTAPYIQYLIFDGFIIDGMRSIREGVYITRGAHHIRIQNCEIKNSTAHGILVPKESGGFNEFIRLNVHHNGTRARYDHGMYISAKNNIVENSKIHYNTGYGVHIYAGGESSANNNIVRNNEIYENGTLPGTSYGLLLGSGKGNIAHNNLIYKNSGGVSIAYNAVDTQVYKNTIYSNTPAYGIFIQPTSTRAVVRDNIVYNNPIINKGYNSIISNNSSSNTNLAVSLTTNIGTPSNLRIVSP